MNNRRKLIVALGAFAVSPRMALGQAKQPVLIGWLHTQSPKSSGHFLEAFKEGMASLGRKERFHFVLEERWADGRVDRLPRLASELAAKSPALIVAAALSAVVAAAKAVPRTPIVQASGTDPVAAGLAANLARPGGMVTGVTNVSEQVSEKSLELLLAAVPALRRIGFLLDSTPPSHGATIDSARRSVERYSVDARFAEAASAEEIEPLIRRLAKEGAQGLIVMPGVFFLPERHRIAKLALAYRWPLIGTSNEYSEAGALLSYGADRVVLYRRAAYYVDRILKGAKPGDLPIEQPTKFELVLNMKTAKALGLTIPQPFLMRADRVIE